MNWTLMLMPLTIVGAIWVLKGIAKELWWIGDLMQNYAKAAQNQKMMYEWAHKNQAWCSKNQLDLEALERRVKRLEIDPRPPEERK